MENQRKQQGEMVDNQERRKEKRERKQNSLVQEQ
jgi:hypothetical protein